MSTAATSGGRQYQPDMPTYIQPHYPPLRDETSRSRASSAASKYTPDGYPTRPTPEKTDSMGYLRPQAQHAPPPQSGGPFMPSDPEQYRTPPAALSGAVPPAQLPPYYQDNRQMVSDGYDQSGSGRRRASATSHYSERSRKGSHAHSHHSHRDDDDYDHHHSHGDHSRHSKEHKHYRHFSNPEVNDKFAQKLSRKNTPGRSYGGSLFALFDSVKNSLRGT